MRGLVSPQLPASANSGRAYRQRCCRGPGRSIGSRHATTGRSARAHSVPAGIYALYVLGQIEYIRRHDLRSLESAALAVESLLETTRTNAQSLLADPTFACTFFQRQTLAKLVAPDKCATLQDADPIPSASFNLDTRNGKVEITGPLVVKGAAAELRIEIPLTKFLEQIPFGAAFDQMLIVDQSGSLLGSAIGVQRGSPCCPRGARSDPRHCRCARWTSAS